MKAKSKVFRIISYLLTITILSQSCTIYKSSGIGVDEAIKSNNKVKVTTHSNQTYTFKKLGKDEAGVYGMAGKSSKAAKQLYNNILQEDPVNQLVKIGLDESHLNEIRARNKTLSILVPVIIVAAGVIIFALTYQVNASPW